MTSEKPKKKYLYVWIDILGFSSLIKTGEQKTYEKTIELVNDFRNAFKKTGPEFLIPISDGIVLIFDVEKNKIGIKNIFKKIAKTQIEFIINNGKFLRGGFALGTIHEKYYRESKDKKTVFLVSNGLVNAYEIESNFINYPIIGTNEATKEQLDKIKRMEGNKDNFMLVKINSQEGGFLYAIDFLKEIESNKKNEFVNIICQKIKEFSNNEKILNKYIWLLRYYETRIGEKGTKCNEYLKGVLL